MKSLPTTSEFIKKYGLDAKKSLGQNFILDKNFTDKIAKTALNDGFQDFSNDTILEIGAGPGSLTRSILDLNPKKLIVIEKDERCIKILQEMQEFYGVEKLEIINGDALKISENDIFANVFSSGEKIKIIANLPYNIGTILLIKWLKMAPKILSMTLMLQKEVAQRIAANFESKDYGRLAIMTQNFAQAKILFHVNQSVFTPPPKVVSSVIQIKPYEKPLFNIEFKKLERTVAAAFNQRRKMIKSSLKAFDFIDEIDAQKALEKVGIKNELRAENVTIKQFCDLANLAK